jgi:hypothetical protein
MYTVSVNKSLNVFVFVILIHQLKQRGNWKTLENYVKFKLSDDNEKTCLMILLEPSKNMELLIEQLLRLSIIVNFLINEEFSKLTFC